MALLELTNTVVYRILEKIITELPSDGNNQGLLAQAKRCYINAKELAGEQDAYFTAITPDFRVAALRATLNYLDSIS